MHLTWVISFATGRNSALRDADRVAILGEQVDPSHLDINAIMDGARYVASDIGREGNPAAAERQLIEIALSGNSINHEDARILVRTDQDVLRAHTNLRCSWHMFEPLLNCHLLTTLKSNATRSQRTRQKTHRAQKLSNESGPRR